MYTFELIQKSLKPEVSPEAWSKPEIEIYFLNPTFDPTRISLAIVESSSVIASVADSFVGFGIPFFFFVGIPSFSFGLFGVDV